MTGAALVTAQAYRGAQRRAREAAATGSLIADTRAGQIEYAERGTGTPLFSIHGAGGGFDQGLASAADLVGEGFHVVAPSRFGYLRTPVPANVTHAAQADAHAALLDALGIERAVVAGFSAGARSAVELAIRHPERVSSLLLVVPGTYSPTSPVSVEPSRSSQMVFALVERGADFAWWALLRASPAMVLRFLGVPPGVFAAAGPAARARALTIAEIVEPLSQRVAGIAIDSNPEPGAPHFERVAAPTLIVSARDDLFNTLPAAEFAARSMANAKLLVFETGGHLLLGREAELRAAVADFLAG